MDGFDISRGPLMPMVIPLEPSLLIYVSVIVHRCYGKISFKFRVDIPRWWISKKWKMHFLRKQSMMSKCWKTLTLVLNRGKTEYLLQILICQQKSMILKNNWNQSGKCDWHLQYSYVGCEPKVSTKKIEMSWLFARLSHIWNIECQAWPFETFLFINLHQCFLNAKTNNFQPNF